VKRRSTTAIQSVLQLLPSSLQRLHFSCRPRRRSNELLAAHVQALALPHLAYMSLQDVAWSIDLPTRLQELCLLRCKVSDELHLPATLRKFQLWLCSRSNSSSSSSGRLDSDDYKLTVHLNEGLQQLELTGVQRVEYGSALPSTLTHLLLMELFESDSTSPLGALPSGLQRLEMNRHLDKAPGVLFCALQQLTLGCNYTQPLGVLPDTLIELNTGSTFNEVLGALPQSLKSLRIGSNFSHSLGPLPLHLEHLHIGEPHQ
jgi:hypothetical protein